MPLIRKTLNLGKKEYYETHLGLVNVLLPRNKMTPKEIEVLAMFMGLEGDIARDRFGPSAKKLVKQALEISDAGLSNYMNFLRKKGFIYNHEGEMKIHPIVQTTGNEQEYQFKLNKIESNAEAI